MLTNKIMKENRIVKILILVAVGFAIIVGSVQAQQADLSALIQRARDAGVDQSLITELQNRASQRNLNDRQVASLLDPAVQMAENNLPAEIALQKALEGLAKGVPDSRIQPVLNSIQSATQQAASIVDPWTKNQNIRQMLAKSGSMSDQAFRREMIKSASRGLMSDIPGQTMSDIFTDIADPSVVNNTGPANMVAAIGVLPDLSTAAGQPQSARSFIVKALKSGFSAGEFQKLPMAVNVAQSRSQLPAASVLERVSKQLNEGVPAARVLQNLFNGQIGGGPPGGTPPGLENNPGRGKGKGQGQGKGQGRGQGQGG